MNLIELTNDFCQNYFFCLRKIASKSKITQSQILCLNAIPFNGISQTNLAKKLSIDISTLSRNLNNLIKLELILKTLSNIDKRSYKIHLTEKGNELYKKTQDDLNCELNDIYKTLTIDEINQFSELLNKINWQFELLYK